MDIYASRSIGFGFVFAFFALLTWFVSDWTSATLMFYELLEKGQDGFFTAAITIVGGMIALPVVGLSVEFVSSFIAELFRGRVDSFPKMIKRGQEAAESLGFPEKYDAKGVYHLVYYSECDPKLRDWSHRRRNRMYASIANALGAILGVLAVSSFLQTVAWSIIAGVVLYAAINLRVFYRELAYHDSMIEAWWQKRAILASSKCAKTINLNVNTSQISD